MIARDRNGIGPFCQPGNKMALGFLNGVNNKMSVLQGPAYA